MWRDYKQRYQAVCPEFGTSHVILHPTYPNLWGLTLYFLQDLYNVKCPYRDPSVCCPNCTDIFYQAWYKQGWLPLCITPLSVIAICDVMLLYYITSCRFEKPVMVVRDHQMDRGIKIMLECHCAKTDVHGISQSRLDYI